MENRYEIYQDPDEALFQPVMHRGRNYYLLVASLSVFVILGIAAYIYQFVEGLTVTGLSRQVFWGVYITDFVFFIGISHAGTLISAILRITKAEWRRPVTRCAELITVMVLFFGVASILIDLGRPDRMFNIVKHANFGSPLLWDLTSVSVYLTCSISFLYTAMIPDIAMLRDRGIKPRWLYEILAIGWRGTERQKKRLNIAVTILCIAVIPVAVSVHTVVSYVFAMTTQPMWHSAIFGPYFVVGAIFSGIAALIIAMAIIRKVYHLENYLTQQHFTNLGYLLLAMTVFWFYFTFGEYLTAWYGHEPTEMKVFWEKFTGDYAPHYWAMVICCFVIPMCILPFNKTRTILGTCIASGAIVIGMWLERYVIIVPTLLNQRLESSRIDASVYPPVESVAAVNYAPSWVEWAIFVGCFAFFVLLYVVFTKYFPIISIWELREGREEKIEEVHEFLHEHPEELAKIQRTPLGHVSFHHDHPEGGMHNKPEK
ncbi:NrfD/PsrC family molybdoenzyme membrane anchor subunit [Chloroflexota bacterium]